MSATERTVSLVGERSAATQERGAMDGLAPLGSRAGAALIAATVLASMVGFLDASVVNVAIPAIGLSDGYQFAMLALGGLCVAGAIVTRLFVSDDPPGRSPARPPSAQPRLCVARRARATGGNMTTAATTVPVAGEPQLRGQTVVVIGGSAGIGLEVGRRARAEGADIVLTGRNPERLEHAARELDTQRTAVFDANDRAALERFFDALPKPIDHVMVTAGAPHYGRMLDMDFDEARQAISEHMLLALEVARNVAGKVRPGGTLLLMGGTGGRRIGLGLGIASAVTAALPPLTASLALELAPVRVNLIAPGFVDTPLSASILGDGLDARREELRTKLPIGRVVGPEDVAALAIHIMSNTALTGATYDIDGGQQFVW